MHYLTFFPSVTSVLIKAAALAVVVPSGWIKCFISISSSSHDKVHPSCRGKVEVKVCSGSRGDE